jgi:hypothetical protein
MQRPEQARSALGDLAVARRVALVLDDEDEVETRQDGRLQLDVLARALQVVVPAAARA